MTAPEEHNEPQGRWPQLAFLSTAALLGMSLWFSASAIVPELAAAYGLGEAAQAWLTLTVQLGFVCGALASAALNLADRVPAEKLVAAAALVAAGANATIAACDPGSAVGLAAIYGLRFGTGALLACVYPPAMKLMASWFRRGRGFALGVLIGALAVGSALPHGLAASNAADGVQWRTVLLLGSIAAAAGGFIAFFLVKPGPLLLSARRFDWRHATVIVTDPAVRRANGGYLGHMWELYAMWTWVPLCIVESYRAAGWSDAGARLAGFVVVASGAIGCIAGGRLADRYGRTLVASASLAVSGACCLVAGLTVDVPLALTIICIVWGIAVPADSAQFSTAVTELCDPRYVGTALTMQTCSGFLLTIVTIRLLTPLEEAAGWTAAFSVLALGPVFGIVSMLRLRRMPEAARMAGGKR